MGMSGWKLVTPSSYFLGEEVSLGNGEASVRLGNGEPGKREG